jgi:L-aspartate oxidase
MKTRKADVLIIGSGLAGLMTAELLSMQKNVIIFTKGKLEDSNSYLAQGGIAAATHEKDSWYDHFFDTLQAGCFHNELDTTERLVKNGPAVIDRLVNLGVRFDCENNGSFQYGKEGAHSRSRILHICGDSTGRHLIDTIKRRIIDKDLVIEGESAVELIMVKGRCVGTFSIDEHGEVVATYASSVILATGGLSGLYPINSNAKTITGDGIALAYEAGAELSDLEFIQFHPTLLFAGGKCSGLITEAVRGARGKLVDQDGNPVMEGEHPLGDLAPRDVVSRVLYRARQNGDETYLDIRSIEDFPEKFPTATRLCEENGVELQKGVIPVAPGAHFTMGGITVNSNSRTTIDNLYAVGEAANTGVHGANRLASNSLLEGIVFACELAEWILSKPSEKHYEFPKYWKGSYILTNTPNFHEIKSVMDRWIGIERHEQGLKNAVDWFEAHLSKQTFKRFPTLKEIQLRHHLLVGSLVARSALERTESRGSHYRSDHPLQREEWKQKRVIRRKKAYEPIKSTTGSRAVFH